MRVDALDQDRQTLSRTGVHAGLTVALGLPAVDLLPSDRAGSDQRAAGRVLDGPLGQVEVERADRSQAFAVVDPLDFDDSLASVGAGDGTGNGAQPPLPGAGDDGGEDEAVDAGVMALQIGPEQAGQVVSDRGEATVVESRLAFLEVGDREIADVTGGELVLVDQLFRGFLSGDAQVTQRGWCIGSEAAHLVGQSVEQAGRADISAARGDFGVRPLQDFPRGDVSDSRRTNVPEQPSTMNAWQLDLEL